MNDEEIVSASSADPGEPCCQNEVLVEDKENDVLSEDEGENEVLNKLRVLVRSERELESYLLRKLEKQYKAKDGTASIKGVGLLEKIKQFFKSPKESRFFLERETKNYLKEHPDEKVDEKSEPLELE